MASDLGPAYPDGADGGSLQRTMPHNLEAEEALLGAILVNNDAALRVSSFLEPEHFFEPLHGRIFAAAMKLVGRGHIATPVTLKTYFEGEDALTDIGGATYLARLAGAATTIINAEDYGRLIYDLALRRHLIEIGEDMVNTAYDAEPDQTALSQIEATEQQLFTLAQKGTIESAFRPLSAALGEAIENAEAAFKRDGHLSGIATGFRDLDDKLGGLNRSDLVILAGRPSMGKTALATNIALNASRAHRTETGENGERRTVDGAAVAFFSLEMSGEQLATRLLAEESGISSVKLRHGKITDDEFAAVVGASQELERLPLFIDDTPALTIAALTARARRLKRTHDIDLIIVDYLQLLRPARQRRDESRVLEISEITQGLKALAKLLDVPVLALSQLNRAVEQREDKRPLLADLRESGAIEQDADIVTFIYRDEYYLERRKPADGTAEFDDWKAKMEAIHGVAEIIIGKHRHGPTGTVELAFIGELTKFGNLAKADRVPNVPF